jgi:hypothetical protein
LRRLLLLQGILAAAAPADDGDGAELVLCLAPKTAQQWKQY